MATMVDDDDVAAVVEGWGGCGDRDGGGDD